MCLIELKHCTNYLILYASIVLGSISSRDSTCWHAMQEKDGGISRAARNSIHHLQQTTQYIVCHQVLSLVWRKREYGTGVFAIGIGSDNFLSSKSLYKLI